MHFRGVFSCFFDVFCRFFCVFGVFLAKKEKKNSHRDARIRRHACLPGIKSHRHRVSGPFLPVFWAFWGFFEAIFGVFGRFRAILGGLRVFLRQFRAFLGVFGGENERFEAKNECFEMFLIV
jgi:hypothetical protein